MVLGFGRGPCILETREIEDNLLFAIGELDSDSEAWLITPYITIDKLSSIRRQITEACKRGANVNVVVRDEPGQVEPALIGFKEALSHGLNLYAFRRLHAKVYWFQDHFSIVTSANLVDGSFEGSTEIGLKVDPGGLHDQLRGWIEQIIVPGLKLVSKGAPRKKAAPQKSSPSPKATKPSKQTGHCIRCNKEIPLAPERPYCIEHFRSWDQYRNNDFEEKVCHACGKPNKSTMAKPICYSCYKKLWT